MMASVRCSASNSSSASARPRLTRLTSAKPLHSILGTPRGQRASTFPLNEPPQLQRRSIAQAQMSTLVSQGHEYLAALSTMPAAWPVLGCIGLSAVVVLYAFWDAWRLTVPPELSYQNTKFNDAVLSRMPALRRPFKPLPGLTIGSGHIETIFAAKTRIKIDVTYRREILHMPDGGIVSLDWRVPRKGEQKLPDDAPVLILLPGLTGGSDDSYVRYAAHYAEKHGTRAVVFSSRGCGDTFLTTPRFYSGLYIGDMQRVVHAVRLRHPRSLMFSAGWSLGANILTNYLGLVGEDTPLDAAAVMCNPFDLFLGSQELMKGFNTIYSKNLGVGMSKLMHGNLKVWNGVGDEFDIETACNAPSVRAWDDAITRVSFGFKTVDDYYKAASSAQRVGDVKVPLLVIQAADDPIAPIAGTPKQALHDNPNCILADVGDAVTKTGGHLGWASDVGGYTGEPWTDHILIEWLLSVQVQLSRDTAVALEGRNGSRLPPPPTTPSYSKALPLSLQPSVHKSELSHQGTPPLAVVSSRGSSNGRTSGRVASRGSGTMPPTSGAIYDTVSGLPVEKHDGVSLSPSQTGYFGPGGDSGKRDTVRESRNSAARQLRLEDVYREATVSGPRMHESDASASGNAADGSSKVPSDNTPSVNNGNVNSRAPLLPVVSELEVAESGGQWEQKNAGPGQGRGTESLHDAQSGSISNDSSGNDSSGQGKHAGFSTPVLQSRSSSFSESQGPDKVTSPFNSTGDLSSESSYAMLGSLTGRSTAQHAYNRPSGASRAAVASVEDRNGQTAGVEHSRSYEMTDDGLREVVPESIGTVTPPRLGERTVDSQLYKRANGVRAGTSIGSDQLEARVDPQNGLVTSTESKSEIMSLAQPHAGASAAQGVVYGSLESTQGREEGSSVDWVNASPQRLAGAAAALTLLYEAASSKLTSAASGHGSETHVSREWGDAADGRVGSASQHEQHMLAAFREGVSRVLKRSRLTGREEECAVEASDAFEPAAGAPPPVVDVNGEKQLKVSSAIRLSGSNSGSPRDGSPSTSTGGLAPAIAAVTGQLQHGRTGQQHQHRISMGSARESQGVRKSLWWET